MLESILYLPTYFAPYTFISNPLHYRSAQGRIQQKGLSVDLLTSGGDDVGGLSLFLSIGFHHLKRGPGYAVKVFLSVFVLLHNCGKREREKTRPFLSLHRRIMVT